MPLIPSSRFLRPCRAITSLESHLLDGLRPCTGTEHSFRVWFLTKSWGIVVHPGSVWGPMSCITRGGLGADRYSRFSNLSNGRPMNNLELPAAKICLGRSMPGVQPSYTTAVTFGDGE